MANDPPVERVAGALGLASKHREALALLKRLVLWGSLPTGELLAVQIHLTRGVRHQELVRGAWDPLYAGHLSFVDQSLNKGLRETH